MPIFAGDRVIVRGEQWTVEDATGHAGVTLLNLRLDRGNAERRQSILLPFDRPILAGRTREMRVVSRRRWMHRLREELAQRREPGHVRAAAEARIDVLPFQLEPVLALVRGAASRFLLADEVGLGKTIQAGLMLAELQQRGLCDRAIVLAPAALRQQWAEELTRRFRIDAAIAEAGTVASLADALPPDVNPWAVHPTVIASIDFVKQPEVRQPLLELIWDMVIVDEAHHASASSQRREVIDALARRARHVVLLTATPHSGDDGAYRALCALGSIGADDRLLTFRRTRAAVHASCGRKVRLLRVRQNAQARAMDEQLSAYAARLWRIAGESGSAPLRLAAMILAKRSFSSAHSLRLSLERRLAGLGLEAADATQPALPLWGDDDPADEGIAPAVPAFDRIDDERGVLQRLIHTAGAAEANDPKIAVLRRLLRRIREPVIVFTEYRDTLLALAPVVCDERDPAMLHGGQTGQERREALRDFTAGRSRLLLATDAGAEGLNLQATCRVVINLELPWSPTRLEQRIGRVDRIGQTRAVHVINLIADGTAECTVLAGLLQRLERIRLSDIDIADCVLNRVTPVPRPALAATTADPIDPGGRAAHAEALRVEQWRQHVQRAVASPEQRVFVTAVVSRQTASNATAVALFRARIVNAVDRLVEDALIPVQVSVHGVPRLSRSRDVKRLAEGIWAAGATALVREARAFVERRALELTVERDASTLAAVRRERAIAALNDAHPLVQAGLFDARDLRQHERARELNARSRAQSVTRSERHESEARLRCADDPQLAMLLIRCSPG